VRYSLGAGVLVGIRFATEARRFTEKNTNAVPSVLIDYSTTGTATVRPLQVRQA
jgi:hypothetical protein